MGDGVFEVLSTSGDTHLGGDDFDKVCKWDLAPVLCFNVFSLLKLPILIMDSVIITENC